ncbi:unnamed protein product, partial [Aphanomyces euteiches]
MSLWTDNVAHVLWLDSTYPTNVSATTPGVGRGTCDMTTGVPKEVQAQYPDATVKYSNIRVGDLGTTTTVHTPSTSPSTSPSSVPTTSPSWSPPTPSWSPPLPLHPPLLLQPPLRPTLVQSVRTVNVVATTMPDRRRASLATSAIRTRN